MRKRILLLPVLVLACIPNLFSQTSTESRWIDWAVSTISVGLVAGVVIAYHKMVICPRMKAVDKETEEVRDIAESCRAEIKDATSGIYDVIRESEQRRTGFEQKMSRDLGHLTGKVDMVLRTLNGKRK